MGMEYYYPYLYINVNDEIRCFDCVLCYFRALYAYSCYDVTHAGCYDAFYYAFYAA